MPMAYLLTASVVYGLSLILIVIRWGCIDSQKLLYKYYCEVLLAITGLNAVVDRDPLGKMNDF